MASSSPATYDRFRALAHPVRRGVVERLARGPASMSELAEPSRMSLPAFSQHLRVLEGCGMVRSRKSGRVRTYRLAPQPFRGVDDWLDRQRALWERRLDQFDDYVTTLEEERP